MINEKHFHAVVKKLQEGSNDPLPYSTTETYAIALAANRYDYLSIDPLKAFFALDHDQIDFVIFFRKDLDRAKWRYLTSSYQ